MISKVAMFIAVIGACLMAGAGNADARTWPAAPSYAFVTSGGSQSCLTNTWARTSTNCSSNQVFFPVDVDTSGNKNFTVIFYGQGECNAVGMDNGGDSYWTGSQLNGVAGTWEPMAFTVYVPDGGYAFIACTIDGPGSAGGASIVASINLSNP
jgi:hypothetical protein